MNVVFSNIRQGLFLSYQLNITLVTYIQFYLIHLTMNKMHFEKSAYNNNQIMGLSKKMTDNTSTFLILLYWFKITESIVIVIHVLTILL